MTNTTNQPDKKSMPDTAGLPAAAGVPPMPWVDTAASMVKGSNDLVHLVRLSEVVRWLMAAKRLGFVPATKALHKALKVLALYLEEGNGVASAVGDSGAFQLDTPPSVRRVISAGIGRDGVVQPAPQSQPLPEGVTPGLSAALHFIGEVWGGGNYDAKAMDAPGWDASRLAMPCEQAAELWGGGEVVSLQAVPQANADPRNWSELVLFRNEHVGANWPVAHKRILASEFSRRAALPGASGVAKSMASELPSTTQGKTMSEKRLNELKAHQNEEGKRKTSFSKTA